ncbi:hypothetical protein FHG87_001224, partial [Trinorchestia longiramus]
QLQLQRQQHQDKHRPRKQHFQSFPSQREEPRQFVPQQPPALPPRRRARAHRPSYAHTTFGVDQRRSSTCLLPASRNGSGSSSRGTRDVPLATSTPRHARALPRFNQQVPVQPYVPQSAVPWSIRTSLGAGARPVKPPLPPVADRGLPRRRHRRLARSRDGQKTRISSKASSASRFPRDDTFSDISVVSPMPSLDVSYTAYLTPDVLTPSIIPVQPSRLTRPRFDEFLYDEYGEPFVQHNPIYSPSEELPELTLSTLASGSPPTPPYIHATNVFERLERVRRHLERSSHVPKAAQEKEPAQPAFPLSQESQVDSDYETPDHFSDESKFSPRRDVASVGTQTPDYSTVQHLFSPEDEIPQSSDESTASSSPSRSPVVVRPKQRFRSHKSSIHRKRRQRKIHHVTTPLSPIAENNGLNGFNGISTPVIISTITSAITASSREFQPSYIVRSIDDARKHQLPYSHSGLSSSRSYGTLSPDESLPPARELPYVSYGATKTYAGLPRVQHPLQSRSRGISYPVARQHVRHGVTFRPHRKRLRRKRRGLALSREFLYVRMFDIQEDARFVYIILVLIQMFLRFEQ